MCDVNNYIYLFIYVKNLHFVNQIIYLHNLNFAAHNSVSLTELLSLCLSLSLSLPVSVCPSV